MIFLLGANRPGAKRLGGRNDQVRNDLGRNAAGAKRLGGELDLGRNDPDSPEVQTKFSRLCTTEREGKGCHLEGISETANMC